MDSHRRAYRIRCYPNGAQRRLLAAWFGSVRWLWNVALEMRSRAWKDRRESLTGIDISRQITVLKRCPEFAWLAKVPATCLTQCLRDLDSAFSHFFRRIKQGEKRAGYPRFKARSHAGSLRFQDVSPKWRKGILSLPKLGVLKLAEDLPEVEHPDTVTLRLDPDDCYYVSFSAEVEIEPLAPVASAVGVDLGLHHLATLSSGERIENPRKLTRRLRYLRQQQRCLSRRVKGSRRWHAQRIKVARAHTRVVNQRSNAIHSLTTRLVREHQIICIEDLAVKNMIQHPRLAGQLADASFGEIRRQLNYKTQWYGRTLVTVDRFYPSSKTCSACGHILDELRLDVREWICPKCGSVHDRDLNAAMNLLGRGLAQLGPGEPGDLRVEAGGTTGSDVRDPVVPACEARTRQLTDECTEHESGG